VPERGKVQGLLKKQASIGDDGTAVGAGAFACDGSVDPISTASPASSLPLLCRTQRRIQHLDKTRAKILVAKAKTLEFF
jgi:hypothetical protein